MKLLIVDYRSEGLTEFREKLLGVIVGVDINVSVTCIAMLAYLCLMAVKKNNFYLCFSSSCY